jgi:hypothetical protein
MIKHGEEFNKGEHNDFSEYGQGFLHGQIVGMKFALGIMEGS